MSDQFQRHARQWHQQQHQQSVQRGRDWQQQVFRSQRENQAHLAARGGVAGRGRGGMLMRFIVFLAVLAALAFGAFLVVGPDRLHAWFG